MTKLSRKYIENIKNVILVVLFLSAVLLFYFFWQNNSLDAFKFPEVSLTSVGAAEEEPVPIADVIQPEEISIHQGNGMYKVVNPYDHQIWLDTIDQLVSFSKGQNILSQEITAEEFADLQILPYIQYRFGYSIPFSQFCEYYGLGKNSAYDSIARFTNILYSDKFEDSIFFVDWETNRYYRLISDKTGEDENNLAPLTEIITAIEKGNYPDYRTISEMVSPLEGTENDRLLPIAAMNSTLTEFPYSQEDSSESSSLSRGLATSFFGSSLDFVRTTIDKRGSVIYTYDGYRKIYTMAPGGVFEYREEVTDSSSSTRFFEALESALGFVSRNGGWTASGGIQMAPYLDDAEVIEVDGRRAYRFTFGIRLNGYKVYYEDSAPVIVEVVGTQVTYYRRDMVDFTSADYTELTNQEERQSFVPINVAASNTEGIAKLMASIRAEQGAEPLLDMDFETISQYIVYMRMGLLRMTEEEATVLKPVWVLQMKDCVLYFDLYTAEPIPEDLFEQE